MADPRDVGRDLHLVRQANAGDLAERRVRLLGRHRPDLEAHAALLRGAGDRHLALPQAVPVLAHGRRLDLGDLARAAVTHELTDRRHEDAAPLDSDDCWWAGVGWLGAGAASGEARETLLGGGALDGWPARAPTADPSRGHERGVYQRPENGVKRILGPTGAWPRGSAAR